MPKLFLGEIAGTESGYIEQIWLEYDSNRYTMTPGSYVNVPVGADFEIHVKWHASMPGSSAWTGACTLLPGWAPWQVEECWKSVRAVSASIFDEAAFPRQTGWAMPEWDLPITRIKIWAHPSWNAPPPPKELW